MNISKLTPLGRADIILKKEIEDVETKKRREYDGAYQKYRRIKILQLVTKIFLYASIVNSIATAIGLNVEFIANISSYIGTSVLIIIYSVLTYFSEVYREIFYVKRELLIGSQD